MANRVYDFLVPMKPVAKERARSGRSGRFYTPRATVEAERFIAAYAVKAKVKRIFGPVKLTVWCWVMPPASWSKKRQCASYGTAVGVRPDHDNYMKTVSDALKGIAWKDDGQVSTSLLMKRYNDVAMLRIIVEPDECDDPEPVHNRKD